MTASGELAGYYRTARATSGNRGWVRLGEGDVSHLSLPGLGRHVLLQHQQKR